MRLFVAVTPDERFREALSAAVDPWRERLALRWTPPGQWHVTLQFLGEWPESRLENLQRALAAVAGDGPFAVRPAGPGVFPTSGRPRVLFVHLDGGENLPGLAAAVRAAVGRVWPDGPQDDRPFRAHLTLARVRDPQAADGRDLLSRIDLSGLPPFVVEGFSLVASALGPGGARHRELGFRRLRKKGE